MSGMCTSVLLQIYQLWHQKQCTRNVKHRIITVSYELFWSRTIYSLLLGLSMSARGLNDKIFSTQQNKQRKKTPIVEFIRLIYLSDSLILKYRTISKFTFKHRFLENI